MIVRKKVCFPYSDWEITSNPKPNSFWTIWQYEKTATPQQKRVREDYNVPPPVPATPDQQHSFSEEDHPGVLSNVLSTSQPIDLIDPSTVPASDWTSNLVSNWIQ
jgi:hypothetical protein